MQIKLLEVAKEVDGAVRGHIAVPRLLNIRPSIRQIGLASLVVDTSKRIQDMSQSRAWDVLWWRVSGIDSPAEGTSANILISGICGTILDIISDRSVRPLRSRSTCNRSFVKLCMVVMWNIDGAHER